MKVYPVQAYQDNFMYIIESADKSLSLLVDPVTPLDIVNKIKSEKLVQPSAILTTHHHWDHADGNKEMVSYFPEMKVYGGCSRIQAFGGLEITCLHTPCHTNSHICYYIIDKSTEESAKQPGSVFTGDTLFISGCGKFFEGNAHQMNIALNTILSCLPKDTLVYCGHEYTITNLKFCHYIEPLNKDIKDKLEWAIQVRKNGEFTIPSTIEDELKCNINSHLQNSLGSETLVDCMDILRNKKNMFVPN